MFYRIIVIFFVFTFLINAGVKEAIDAMSNGDYKTARKEFIVLANAGDDKAMITIGLMYHQGQGVKQNYKTAMDWYIKAFKKNNGDAYSNIGVMYRDGLGVKKNKKIAYCLFLITHVYGLGTQDTQYRANSCLRRIIPTMPKSAIIECFHYTIEYIKAYVISKGTIKGIPEKYKPSKKMLALKDKSIWAKGELDFLKNDKQKIKKTSNNNRVDMTKTEYYSVCFSSSNPNIIYVTDVLCDGKPFNVPVGYLAPTGSSSANMFPSTIPKIFTIKYKKNGRMLKDKIFTKDLGLAKIINEAKPAKKITLHFIYSTQGKFITKVHFDRCDDNFKDYHYGELFPDEKNPQFGDYKKLLRAAYVGDTDKIQELMDKGIPSVWANEPVSLTPLEWTIRWNHNDAFDKLIKYIPKDYSGYNYANCVKLAAQDDNLYILKKLLAKSNLSRIPKDELQTIFYAVCRNAKKIETLKTLLKHLKVGVNFRVRDYGHTLLFVAARAGNKKYVKWLLEHGADVDAKLENGERASDYARDEDIQKILIKYQALKSNCKPDDLRFMFKSEPTTKSDDLNSMFGPG